MYKDIPKISQVEARENFQLFMSFEDGVSGVINLSKYKGKGVFEYWNDEKNFKSFKIIYNAITWNENIDMDCDSLYLQIINKDFFEYARD